MELFLFHALIPIIFILIAWLVYRRPIKGDAALSIMWRGTLGGYASGYLGLFVIFGRDHYFFLALIYFFIILPVFAMAFAGVVWVIQKRKSVGLLHRAVLGGITGAVGGAVLDWFVYYFGNNPGDARSMIGAWAIICLSIGVGAGVMAGPRKLPEPDNVEGILRSERDGFRMGNEVRVNTDLEYVLLPWDYQAPGKELFLILESTFVQRGRGRLDGAVVEGSKSTEFYLAPGLQYAADPRFVIEGSVQIPVIQNMGPLVLRTDLNVLLGVRYLF